MADHRQLIHGRNPIDFWNEVFLIHILLTVDCCLYKVIYKSMGTNKTLSSYNSLQRLHGPVLNKVMSIKREGRVSGENAVGEQLPHTGAIPGSQGRVL